ncbi:MAG: hypothetical protein LAO24_08445 [Acidobacteriia bacterium]|nr:hypothetical protein [Terriglobia bacterium]
MKRIPIAVIFFLLFGLKVASAQAAPLALGSISAVTPLTTCPTGYNPGARCFQAGVSCPDTLSIQVTYGVSNPRGIPRGTIVLLKGAGGTQPYGGGSGLGNYGASYLQAGYRIVQTAWATDWEDTGISNGKSVKAAACRPATLLNFFDQNVYDGNGGICAQGFSAGSAQLAYSLALYGSANFLDKVELLSGPVLSDIAQGCMVPEAPPVTVCPPGQLGCVGSPWRDRPQYVVGFQSLVSRWTGIPCQSKTTTWAQDNLAWKSMSIVDGTRTPSFSYPKTAVAGWLCSNALNNSAAQGELFFVNFTSPAQTAHYSLTRIDGCSGPEGVDSGTTPQGEIGFLAITSDMTDPVAGCIKRH